MYGKPAKDGDITMTHSSSVEQIHSTVMEGQTEKDEKNLFRFSLTIVLLAIITLYFFRSILPRIPRLFFRGRLRVKRIGLRGIRGIEWRTQGFNSDLSTGSTASKRRSSISSVEGDNNNTAGFGIKIRHIYLTVRWISGGDHSFYEHSHNDKENHKTVREGNEEIKTSQGNEAIGVALKRKTALITVHIDGVGVDLPRKGETDSKKEQIKQAKQAQQEEEAQKREIEEEEQRLQALMSSRPSSPRPDAKIDQNVSPMPAFSAAMGRALQTSSETETTAVPLQSWNQWVTFIRYSLLPILYIFFVRLCRSLAYLILSMLPLLSRVIDVEIRRVEVYATEQDAVLRIQEMDLGAHMDLVPVRDHSEMEAGAEKLQGNNNFQERLASFLSVLHVSIGSGARNAATIALDGFPGLRANLRIAFHGVQMFDAARARQVHLKKQSEEGDRTIERTPNTSSSFILGSAQEHQWKSFSDFQSDVQHSPSNRGLQKASSEANLISEAKVDSRKRWAGRWTDWTLEKRPNSDFMPHTSWDQGESECRDEPIPATARLMAMQDITSFNVGFILGKAVSARDSLHLSLALAPVTIGADAFAGMFERIQEEKAEDRDDEREAAQTPSKRSNSPRSSAQISNILEMFGSVSVSIPSVLLDMSSKSSFSALSAAEMDSNDAYLPSSIQMLTQVDGFRLSIKTSGIPDELHQSFLGTCGLKNHTRSAIARRALTGGLRWTLGRRRAAASEHRRVFALSASLSHIDVRLGIDGKKPQSKFLIMSDLNVSMRSSWTPIGLLIIGPPTSCFAGDPNEQAIVLDAKMASLDGNVKMHHLCSLFTFFRYRQAERLQRRQEIGIAPDHRKQKSRHTISEQNESMMRQIPRFHVGIELNKMSYCIDASDLMQIGNEKPTLDFMVEIPKISFHAEASYQDQCVRRSESDRKKAWRALGKDELEWSLKPNSRIYNGSTDGSSSSLPAKTGGYFDWRRGSLGESSPKSPDSLDSLQASSPLQPPPPPLHKQPMTMNEALEKMRQIQELEPNQKKAYRPRSREGSVKKSHLSTSSVNSPTHNLRCQSTCSFDQIKMFWIMDGHDMSSQRRARDGENRFPSFVDQITTRAKSHRHVLALNDFETVCLMNIPGDQDFLGNHVTLMTDRRSIDVRTSLEEVDLDMWHTSSLDATRSCLQAISKSSKKVRLSQEDNGEQEGTQSPLPQETDVEELPPLIDLLKPNSSLYCSVGTIVAHLGGSDPRCDPGMFRGIGLDMKRAIFQVAVAKLEPRKPNDPTHYSMGARSALDLPEDQRASVTALAVRHGKAASAKLNVYQMGIFPLLDAQMATAQHIGGNGAYGDGEMEDKYNFDPDNFGSPSIIAPAFWDFQKTRPQHTKQHRLHAKFRQQDRSNFILWVPKFALRANLVPKDMRASKIGKHTEELQIVTEESDLLSFKIEMLHTYCVLVAIASLKSLKPSSPKEDSNKSLKDDGNRMKNSKRKVTRRYQIPSCYAALRIADIQIAVALPNEVNLFIRIQHTEAVYNHQGDSSVGFERLLCAVESPEVPSKGMWEELARMRDCKVRLEDGKEDGTPMRVKVNVDGISFRVPFNYTVHPIIDSTVVSVKATKQLVHQFIKGGNDSVIIPIAEDPKHLPIIDVNVRIFSIEAEDDPFETRLNIIWRSGGDENQARSERESAFEDKIHALENLRTNDPSSESFSSMTNSTSESDEGLEDDRLRRQAKVSIEEARTRLDAFNASSWIRRFGNAQAEQARREEANVRRIYGRLPPHAILQNDLPIKLAPRSRASPLFRSTMTRLHVIISPPSFPESQLRDFLYEQGDEIPRDMEYSLLIPLHMNLRMDEWKIDLRDYPMPLLHFPPINRNSQPDTLAAVELEMDFCIAEQLGSEKALRHISAIVVPAATGRPDAVEYGISIPRMSMPTKFYGSPVLNINSSYPTRLVWGQSVQPAIHDVVRVFEGITSPPHDPSPRIGFWDKMSLIMQGALKVQFPGEGQFHVYLKGSRDPYHILGQGAGWVKCWRGNVELRLGFENPQREVFQILSDEYILAIPDLKDYIDRAATGTERRDPEEESASTGKNGPSSYKRAQSSNDAINEGDKKKHGGHKPPTVASSLVSGHHRYMRDPEFKKICLKLTNGVRWGFGLILERTCTEKSCEQKAKCQGAPFYRICRFWTRKKHWQVYTRSHEYVQSLPEDQRGDSFEGWRSHHLHFSVSIDSPREGKDERAGEHSENDRTKKSSAESGTKANAVNNLYFTPLAWEHFWAWMRLFDSALSLPIRQGKLFPGSLEQSPKFGRHLGTIKYHFNIAPLLISHLYPQANKMDWARGRTTLIGVKARMATFHMDLHQRQQEIVVDRPELGGQRKIFHKPFYEAEVDLSNINFRTLAGQFQEPDKRLVPLQDVDENEDDEHDNIFNDAEEEGHNGPSDHDLEWYDLHDFVELDWAPPEGGRQPKIRLIEAMTCPRFSYYRRIESKGERVQRTKGEKSPDDQENNNETAKLENTKFGNENTHVCLVGIAPTPPKVQIALAEARLDILTAQLNNFTDKSGGEPLNEEFMGGEGRAKAETERARKAISKERNDLHKKIKLVREYIELLNNIQHKVFEESEQHVSEPEHLAHTSEGITEMPGAHSSLSGNDALHEWQAFDNRYFIHNPVIFYSNQTRDVLLKYYLSSRKRRGIVHSLSARAVRTIRDVGKDDGYGDHKRDTAHRTHSSSTVQTQDSSNPDARTTPTPNVSESKIKNRSRSASENFDGILKDAVEYMIPNNDSDKDARNIRSSFEGSDGAWKEESRAAYASLMETCDPQDGISDEFDVGRSNVCVVLKPQIVLRSLVDDKSTVIITAARARLRNYSVKDPRVEEDSVNERVLYRNFIGVDALQGFHPSKKCSFVNNRNRGSSSFVYVPLETLVDVRYETSDFDRICPRTDAMVQYDKFNKLRLNDPNHPVAAPNSEDSSNESDHLRHTMDLIRVRCPRYSVSANADQFGAIYNVVADLLLYRDPAYREHAKKLEVMMFSYDLSDVEALADLVQSLQIRIRHAKELHAQYQLHFDLLNEQGKLDFLSLKAEINDMQDELNLLLEAITQADDHSDKEKKSALRLEASARDVAWNMMGDKDGELLAKLSIRGASFTWMNKADNSVVNSLTVGDLNAVNVDPNAVFQEIITKYNSPDHHPMKENGMLLIAAWSVLPPVGGIAIVDHFELHLHPLRIQIERRIGRQIEEYIFGSMREKRKEREEQEEQGEHDQKDDGMNQNKTSRGKGTMTKRFKQLKDAMRGHNHSSSNAKNEFEERNHHPRQEESSTGQSEQSSPRRTTKPLPSDRRSFEGRRSINLHRTSSRSLVASEDKSRSNSYYGSSGQISYNPSKEGGTGENGGEGGGSDGESEQESGQRAIASRNAIEMRERASKTVTFVSVKVSQTIFCLSYKSEKQKSIMDLYNLVFKSPKLEYRNRTWAHADLANHLKRDIVKAAWKQRSTLIKGVISQKRPPATQRVAQAAMTLTRSRNHTLSMSHSSSQSPTSEMRNALTGAIEYPLRKAASLTSSSSLKKSTSNNGTILGAEEDHESTNDESNDIQNETNFRSNRSNSTSNEDGRRKSSITDPFRSGRKSSSSVAHEDRQKILPSSSPAATAAAASSEQNQPPEFRLHVDPPSFSTTDSHGSLWSNQSGQ